jgi:hypothetical protein
MTDNAAAKNENEVPVLTKAEDRKESIINNTPAVFPIEANPKAVGIKPFY